MSIFSLEKNKIKLSLTSPISSVRICDPNGNHVKKPTELIVNKNNQYIEWMITNKEIIKVVELKLNHQEIIDLVNNLKNVSISLVDSGYRTRKAKKKKLRKSFNDFNIFCYEEIFYSFEKKIKSNTAIRVTFKMGDFTLAAHMFILISFCSKEIDLFNKDGLINDGSDLGSGAYCIWNISKSDIINITRTLATSSRKHRDDLIQLLNT